MNKYLIILLLVLGGCKSEIERHESRMEDSIDKYYKLSIEAKYLKENDVPYAYAVCVYGDSLQMDEKLKVAGLKSFPKLKDLNSK